MKTKVKIKNVAEFKKELTYLINKHSIENHGDVPDYMLSEYVMRCIFAVGVLCEERDAWFGFVPFRELDANVFTASSGEVPAPTQEDF